MIQTYSADPIDRLREEVRHEYTGTLSSGLRFSGALVIAPYSAGYDPQAEATEPSNFFFFLFSKKKKKSRLDIRMT